MAKFDAAETISNQIIEAIESGLADGSKWVMPWHLNGTLAMPVNALTKKSYRGGNIVALWARGKACNYSSGYWASFKQWKELGATVKKGSKGSMIVFWKKFRAWDADGSEENTDGSDGKTYMKSWSSKVFNADQVEGWEIPEARKTCEAEIIDTAEAFFINTGIEIRYGQSKAFYRPSEDFIGMPDRDCFIATEHGTATDHLYSTLAHEAAHASGASHRLDRDLSGRFGSEKYAAEELIAEITAAMVSSLLGFSSLPRADHFHYVKNWLDVLKGDKYAIFTAASKAQEATEYLQSLQPVVHAVAAE